MHLTHPVTQILKTGLRCPRVWSLWKPGHICERRRHISMQDVKLALQPFCISLRFMLGILWTCLNVKISLYTFFSLLEMEISILLMFAKIFYLDKLLILFCVF